MKDPRKPQRRNNEKCSGDNPDTALGVHCPGATCKRGVVSTSIIFYDASITVLPQLIEMANKKGGEEGRGRMKKRSILLMNSCVQTQNK